MTKKKIDVDELVDEVVKAPRRKRLRNWVDNLEPDAKEFLFKVRQKKEEGVNISPMRAAEKLKEHFGVKASNTQVARFLSGEINAQEDFEEASGRAGRRNST